MKQESGHARHAILDNKVLILLIAVLVVNALIAGLNFHFLYLRADEDPKDLDSKKVIAQDLLDYSRRLAKETGVQDRSSVREALAGFNYEIDLAEDGDELARIIFTHGRQLQETILRERDALLQEKILALVNQDENIQQETEKVQFVLSISGSEGALADPPLLEKGTLEEIFELYQESGIAQEQALQIEVEEGRSRLQAPYNPLEYIQSLNEEIDSLRLSLHELRLEAGFAEMVGEGVLIELYDSQDGYEGGDLIHDSDVRDIVNELYAAGAKGVAVGGQRLVATSPIRCVGPVIRVNDREISANPVEIKAVGDPEVLASGLDIIRFSLEYHRGFKLNIEKKEEITLPPYRN